jgi:hypothetical protein
MKIDIKNPSGRQVGYVDEHGTYNTIRNKNQLMYKYGFGVGLSLSILKRFDEIEKKHNIKVNRIDVLIPDFEKDNGKDIAFHAVINLKDYLSNAVDIDFGKITGKINCDKQKCTPLKYFFRIYNTQKQLKEVL